MTDTINKLDSTIFACFLWIAFVGIISWGLFKVYQKLATVKVRGLSILSGSQIPCRNCRFLAKNQYLKCAVRPFSVLTAQAANCSDFCARHESYWPADLTREGQHGSQCLQVTTRPLI